MGRDSTAAVRAASRRAAPRNSVPRPAGQAVAIRAAAVHAASLLAACILWLAGGSATAGSPVITLAGGDSLALRAQLQWENPLPGFVEERLERGIPATVEIHCELWRDRTAWFDRLLVSQVRDFYVVRDPWRGSFSVQEGEATLQADSLAELRSLLAHSEMLFPLERDWCDERSNYKVVVTTVVRPLTARDIGELDGWLKGELGGFRGGLLGLPRGLFGVVTGLSGLGERTEKAATPVFHLSADERGRVRWMSAAS